MYNKITIFYIIYYNNYIYIYIPSLQRTWDKGDSFESYRRYPWYGGVYRFWRKNMSVAKKGCRGVDLNRNFPKEWKDKDEVQYCIMQ